MAQSSQPTFYGKWTVLNRPARQANDNNNVIDSDDFAELQITGTSCVSSVRDQRLQRRLQRPTTDSDDGFQPATFLSSRTHRAPKRIHNDLLSVMDSEDQHHEISRSLAVSGEIDCVAVRMMRRMGWREGRGIGLVEKKPIARKPVTSVKSLSSVSSVRTLPPSLQALNEAEEEIDIQPTQSRMRYQPAMITDTNNDSDSDDDSVNAELSAFDAALTLPDIPLYTPPMKSDTYGLGYQPSIDDSKIEFDDYRQRQEQRTGQYSDSGADNQSTHKRAVWLVDSDGEGDGEDDVIEISSTINSGRQRSDRTTHLSQLPSLRALVDIDDADDRTAMAVENRSHYDLFIGGKKARVKARNQSTSNENPLTFVRSTRADSSQSLEIDPIVVPEEFDEFHQFTDVNNTPSVTLTTTVPVTEAKTKTQMRKPIVIQFGQKPPQSEPVQPAPTSPAAVTTGSALRNDATLDPFLDRFTTGNTATPCSNDGVNDGATLSALSGYEVAAWLGQFGTRTREILSWRPERLLCKRLNIPPPSWSRTETVKSSVVNDSRGAVKPSPEPSVRLSAPSSSQSLVRPPMAVFAEIFNAPSCDDFIRRVERERALVSAPVPTPAPVPVPVASTSQEQQSLTTKPEPVAADQRMPGSSVALSFLSSLGIQPDVPRNPAPLPPSASATAAPFVHPSRRAQVPTTDNGSCSRSHSQAVPTPTPAPVAVPTRRSRWDQPASASASAPEPLPAAATAPPVVAQLPPPLSITKHEPSRGASSIVNTIDLTESESTSPPRRFSARRDRSRERDRQSDRSRSHRKHRYSGERRSNRHDERDRDRPKDKERDRRSSRRSLSTDDDNSSVESLSPPPAAKATLLNRMVFD